MGSASIRGGNRRPRRNRNVVPAGELHVEPFLDGSEDENSLSSPAPLSPPQNNKRIDSYFVPKDNSRHSVSRALFKQTSLPLPQQPSEVVSGSSSDLHTDLPTPPQSSDLPHSPPKQPSVAKSESHLDSFLPSSPGIDLRSKDMHGLLMVRDQRIKELEHVVIRPSHQLGAGAGEFGTGGLSLAAGLDRDGAGGSGLSPCESPARAGDARAFSESPGVLGASLRASLSAHEAIGESSRRRACGQRGVAVDGSSRGGDLA